jgi:hypothetical protein
MLTRQPCSLAVSLRTPLSAITALVVVCAAVVAPHVGAQDPGRVFRRTCETVGLWELNEIEALVPGDPIPTGTVIPDLSGNGLDAVVLDNDSGDVVLGAGDPLYNVPAGEEVDPDFRNTTAGKRFAQGRPRITVPDDGDAFEMTETDDFSLELYVRREEVVGGQTWGILAGTWHSRTLIDDMDNGNVDGAWYGWGFIQRGGQPGWLWVMSPVNPDGTLMSTGCCPNERRNDASWVIPPGPSYVVASVNRSDQIARVYLCTPETGAQEVETITLNPAWSFITPVAADGTPYEHANFTMLTGVDDETAGAFRTAPSGYHLDAARVQKKALSFEEVESNWFAILDGKSVPVFAEAELRANLRASATRVVTEQCIELSGEGSCGGTEAPIATYEWRIGGGAFEEGPPVRELSFDAPTGDAGVDITLRVTDTEGASDEDSVTIYVTEPAVTAMIRVTLRPPPFGAIPLFGDPVVIRAGSVLTLDGTGSSSNVDPDAVRCPLRGGEPLRSAITAYEWDLESDGTVDDTRPSFTSAPWDAPGLFTVTLAVANESGAEDTATVRIKVVEPEQSQVFYTTDDTILHLELNDLPLGRVAGTGDVGVVPDLSGNGLDLTLVDPIGGSFQVLDGGTQFAASRSVAHIANVVFGEASPRGEIRDDFDLFEMGPEDDFTFEIYVRASANVGPQWGDVAGTFRARTDGQEGSPRYGWGIIKSHIDLPGQPGYAWFTPNQTPNEVPVFFHMTADAYNYVACVVDRTDDGTPGTSTVYVNGRLASQRTDIDPLWSFETPAGLPHARFFLFTREQVEGSMFNSPAGTAIDAVRLQGRALSAEEIAANWEQILCGLGANAPEVKTGPLFHRGDPNDSNTIDLTDGIFVLNFLFLGGPPPVCFDAADSNDSGSLDLTDGVYLFNWLFLGGPDPLAPGPVSQPCGEDPTEDAGPGGDLGCLEYDSCAAGP